MARKTFIPRFEEAEPTIRQRILARITGWRKQQGDFAYDMVVPVTPEVQQLKINQDTNLKNSFAQYAEDEALDDLLFEAGLTRAQATPNKRLLNIDADAGVVIPKNYTASVVVLDNQGNPLEFNVDDETVFTAAGTLAVTVTSRTVGAVGNIATGSQFILLPPIPGVRSITDAGTLVPGAAREDNDSAFARYEFKVQNPDTGGNKNDYVRWAQEVTGVGKAKTIMRWNGNGTVKVVLVGTDFAPALPAVVADVQEYIDPILAVDLPAVALTLGGSGVTIDGDDVKMVYDAAGFGKAKYGAALETLIETENHFRAAFRVRVDSIAGAADLLQLSIQDRGTEEPVKQTSAPGAPLAGIVLKANQLGVAFVDVVLPFYWDGLQAIELEIRRLTTDTTTQVWVDKVHFDSLYGQALGEGKAPGNHRVLAEAADALAVNITATVTYATGYDPAAVETAFTAAVTAYLRTLVLPTNPTSIIWAKVGALLIGTEGVSNYTDLTLNGGTADIPVPAESAPTVGTVTI